MVTIICVFKANPCEDSCSRLYLDTEVEFWGTIAALLALSPLLFLRSIWDSYNSFDCKGHAVRPITAGLENDNRL